MPEMIKQETDLTRQSDKIIHFFIQQALEGLNRHQNANDKLQNYFSEIRLNSELKQDEKIEKTNSDYNSKELAKIKASLESQHNLPAGQERIINPFYVRTSDQISATDIGIVGGKSSLLGENLNYLTKIGIKTPDFVSTTSMAFESFKDTLCSDGQTLRSKLITISYDPKLDYQEKEKQCQKLIMETPFNSDLENSILGGYYHLGGGDTAIRSSATAEDLPDASFAGQQDTYLNIKGEEAVLLSHRKCFASLYTARAIDYRDRNKFNHDEVLLCVCMQEMVRSDIAFAGIAMSVDPDSESDKVIVISIVPGLGETAVNGSNKTNEKIIAKHSLATVSTKVGQPTIRRVFADEGGTIDMPISKSQANSTISEGHARELGKQVILLEEYYTQKTRDEVRTKILQNGGTVNEEEILKIFTRVDVEWAIDGYSNELFIVQSRPITTLSKNKNEIKKYKISNDQQLPILTGVATGNLIASGTVHIHLDPHRPPNNFQRNDVLVTTMTTPDMVAGIEPSALITEKGGRLSHGAIIARERGIPAVLGATNAIKILESRVEQNLFRTIKGKILAIFGISFINQNNKEKIVTVSCAEGEKGKVYEDEVPFETETIDVSNIAEIRANLPLSTAGKPVKMQMIIGDPDLVLSNAESAPNDGAGLVRLEFTINNMGNEHPMKLIEENRGQEYADKIALDVAKIATAFYPEIVVIRGSDFKTNEYAQKIGSREPKEENPMVGWRGAGRHLHPDYMVAFGRELEGIAKAKFECGCDNIVYMEPFVRTVEEAQQIYSILKEFGLEKDAKMMCEVPSNIALAKEFFKCFEGGFSIGSNDMTQLTLGLDRDNDIIAHIGNEKNDAVKWMIEQLFKAREEYLEETGIYVPIGICGQGPSDFPDFAEFLTNLGIDSISLQPDSVMQTTINLSKLKTKV